MGSFIRFYRNDSVLYDVIGDYCDNEYVSHVFMAGELTWVYGESSTAAKTTESLYCDFILFCSHKDIFQSHPSF